MALPFLLGLGAVWSGGNWLMERQDSKARESLLTDFMSMASGSEFGQKYGRNYAQAMEAIHQSGSFRNRGAGDDMRSLFTQYINDEQRYDFAQQQHAQNVMHDQRVFDLNSRNIEQQMDLRERNYQLDAQNTYQQMMNAGASQQRAQFDAFRKYENDVQADIAKDQTRFRDIESRVRRIMPGLVEGNMNGMQAYEATLGLLQSLLPGEAIMEGDISAAINAGGVYAELGRMLERWKMGAIDDNWRRDLAGVLDGVYQEETTRWTEVENRALQRLDRYGGDPLNVFQQAPGSRYAVPELNTSGSTSAQDAAMQGFKRDNPNPPERTLYSGQRRRQQRGN